MRNYYPLINSMGSGAAAIDSDAQAFITAASITDSTQQTAINTLVTDLKTYNIWTKMKAIYPFVGGSASTHKWNLKDPRDLDAAYRLVFNGGWTHSSTGALPNGTTGYANTFLNPSIALASASGFGFYSRTNNTVLIQSDMGAQSYFPVKVFDTITSGDTRFFGANSDTTSNFTDSDTRGLYQVYRLNSTTVKMLKNTTLYSATIAAASPNLNVYIGARNENGNAEKFAAREMSLAYIQENFSDTDASNFYTAVQTFETLLTRNV
jgi:hypothetical protein